MGCSYETYQGKSVLSVSFACFLYHSPMLRRFISTHAIAIIALACIALYGPFLGNKLVNWDDDILITTNPVVQQFDIVRGFTTYDPELYIPVTLLSYQIEHVIFGNSAWIFHATNLLLHIGNAILVFLIITLLSRNRFVGLFTALLFALHPINAEAVLWASARKDLLSSFFFLLTILLYIKENRWSIFTFFLGLLSKVSIVGLPLVLLLIDVWEGRGIDADTLRSKRWYFLLSAVFGVVALFGKNTAIGVLSAFDYPLLASKSLVATIGNIFVPTGFSPIYGQGTPVTVSAPEFMLPVLLLCAACVALFVLRNRLQILLWCTAWFVLLFAPSFLTFTKNGYILFMSDRYAYLPGIGIFFGVSILFASVASRGGKRFLTISGAGIAILVACFLLSREQAKVWANSETLMRHAIAIGYDHPLVENNLGSALRSEGKNDEALAAFMKAAEAGNAQAYFNAAELQRVKGDERQMLDLYEKGMQAARERSVVGTQDLASHFAVGQMLLNRGHVAEAVNVFAEAVSIGGNVSGAHLNLGIALMQQGNLQGALKELERASQLNRYSAATFYNLAHVYAGLGQRRKAVEALQRCVAIDPEYPDARKKLDQLNGI